MAEAAKTDMAGISNDPAQIDEAIRAQEAQIEEEVIKSQALVDQKEDIVNLQNEYNERESPKFLIKAKDLQNRYASFRRIRGDGNCFYRALIFAQCDRMLNDPPECERLLNLSKGWFDRLVKAGYPEFTTQDFCDTFVDFIERIKAGLSPDNLLAEFNDGAVSDYYVVFLRLVTGGHLKENADFYANFVEGNRTLAEYCSQEIDPMFKVADHLSITAVTKALGIRLRIEYMDQTEAPSGGWHHDFIEGENASPYVHLLYRHDHYDILYPR